MGHQVLGKLLLLKDIFADMLVEQVRFICKVCLMSVRDESKLIPLPSENIRFKHTLSSSKNAVFKILLINSLRNLEIANDDFL